MTEPEETETVASIEVAFPLERAARIVTELDLIPRFMLHEGKKQISQLPCLRDTLAGELAKLAAEKGITA